MRQGPIVQMRQQVPSSPKLAVRSLVLHALLPGVRADLFAVFKQSVGCRFHLLDRDEGGVHIAQCYFLPNLL